MGTFSEARNQVRRAGQERREGDITGWGRASVAMNTADVAVWFAPGTGTEHRERKQFSLPGCPRPSDLIRVVLARDSQLPREEGLSVEWFVREAKSLTSVGMCVRTERPLDFTGELPQTLRLSGES